MYWSDVYSSNVRERLMREERAARNIDRRLRAYHAGNHRRTHRKPTTRKAPIRKAPVIALPALPQRLILGAAMLFATMFVTVTVGFAATGHGTETMLDVRDDIMQEEQATAESTQESVVEEAVEEEISYAIAETAPSEETPVVPVEAEAIEEPVTDTGLIAAAPQDVESENIVDTASSANAVAITVPQTDTGVDHTQIWQNVSAYDFTLLDLDEKIDLIGAMAHDDELATGIPAELTAAQMILESGWMESGLTQNANNCFGIKASSGGYNWENSTWDGVSVAEMETQEEYTVGEITTIVDGFRAYNSVWDSVCDHSAYLLNSGLYPGIADPNKSLDEILKILVDGGYATGSNYAPDVKLLIDTYDLDRFGC